MPTLDKPFYTIPDLAELFRKTPATIRRYIRIGAIPPPTLVGGVTRVWPAEVVQQIISTPTAPAQQAVS